MKSLLLAVVATVFAVPAFAADVSASISVSQPGFYGQINIGNFPHPEVIYPQPVWVARPPDAVRVQPIYLHVPPGHEKHWSKHCAEYGACGRPVYFVREDWYENEYVPSQHHQDGNAPGKGNGKGNGKAKGNDKGD